MAVNRRNYYRILHVQPEAPEPVITASYRTMMSKLRLHPDLGGDTANAALINEAYAVLRDPQKRARYDAERRRKPGARQAAQSGRAGAYNRAAATSACPFCGVEAPSKAGAIMRCGRCGSPLAAPPARPTGKKELFGRRALPRMARTDALTLVPAWQSRAREAQLRDLSYSGISVIADLRIEPEQVIRIVGHAFDVLATVVNCRGDGRNVEIHAALLHAIFGNSTGTVVSVKA